MKVNNNKTSEYSEEINKELSCKSAIDKGFNTRHKNSNKIEEQSIDKARTKDKRHIQQKY